MYRNPLKAGKKGAKIQAFKQIQMKKEKSGTIIFFKKVEKEGLL